MSRHLHIVLDEAMYQEIRQAAFRQNTSIGDIVRQSLARYLGLPAGDQMATERATPRPRAGELEGR